MSTATEQQARTNALLAAAAVDMRVGVCTGIDWVAGVATVAFPGSTLDLPMTGVPPIINEKCRVLFVGTTATIFGPVTRPPLGTVSGAPSGGLVEVLCDDNQKRMVTFDGGSIAVGTVVLLDWTPGGEIIGTPVADPNTGEQYQKPHADIGQGGVKDVTFNPYTSATWADGSYGSGWKSGQLWDSDHNRGAWFYQGIADTIPDNAVGGRLTIHIPPGSGYGGNPSIGAHGLGGPSGNLSITGRKAIPSGGGDIDISEFFDAFKTGAVLGIGTGGGGNWRFPPAGQYNSGAIHATWRT